MATHYSTMIFASTIALAASLAAASPALAQDASPQSDSQQPIPVEDLSEDIIATEAVLALAADTKTR